MHSTTPAPELLTALPGVGPARAAALLAFHGDQLWDRLEADPARALACPGALPASKVHDAAITWATMQSQRSLHRTLAAVGLAWLTPKLTELNGDSAARLLQGDPYRVVSHGATLVQADRLAARSDPIAAGAIGRGEAAIHAVLCACERAGGSCIAEGPLLADAARLLDSVLDVDQLAVAARAGRLVWRGGLVWSPRAYEIETRVATHLRRLADTAVRWPAPLALADGLLEEQQAAITSAWEHGVSVVVGKAGTGKTHVIAAVAAAARAAGLAVTACAPTGRAARNLELVTDSPASTIHRLVGHNDTHAVEPLPLAADLVLLDEASLLDIDVFLRLIEIIPSGSHLALVGDPMQLPPVGPGRVLQDIVDSAEIPVVALPHVLRQSPRSAITRAAAAISDGYRPAPGRLVDGSDFELSLTAGASDTAARIVTLVRDELPALYDVDPMCEILVLAPGKHGPAGTRALNAVLAHTLNPAAARSASGIAGGDRVMWTSNDPDLGLANGSVLILDRGPVVPGAGRQPIRATAENGRRVILPAAKAARSLIPAFALTAHKSQGLEVPVVVIAMHAEATHPALLSRALLYTAITRASRAVVLMTDEATLGTVIANGRGVLRGRTALGRRIVAITRSTAGVSAVA